MTLTEIIAEMVARGAEDNSIRNGRWANFAYREISNDYDWPFTLTSITGSTGAGFVAVVDVRKVLNVGDVTNAAGIPGRALAELSQPELIEEFDVENTLQSGSPDFWYLSGQTVYAYPFGGTIYVSYHKRLDELTGGQSPVFDEEYHLLVVERAMVEVHNDTGNLEAAKQSLAMFERGLLKMADAYQVSSREHSYIQVGTTFDG